MQNIPTWLFSWQWLNAILGIGAKAAAALPVITFLTLFIGKRGNARLCILGARSLTRLNLALATLGPLLVVSGVLALLAGLRGAERILDGISPWMPAIQPYTTAVLAWAAGLICLILYLATDRTAVIPAQGTRSRRQTKREALRITFTLLAALCFFAALVLPNWPFAALPQGLSIKDMIIAVFLHTTHEYFTAFSPAGGLALLTLSLKKRDPESTGLTADDREKAAHWCALWAMIGYIPRCIDRWGIVIGFSLRPGPVPQEVADQALALVPLTLAIVCWVLLFARRTPQKLFWLNSAALLLLVLGASLPFLRALMQ